MKLFRFAALLLLVGCATTGVKKPVVNKINPNDVSIDLIKSVQPNAHYYLHADGIHADSNIDNVQVYLSCDVPDPNGNMFPANAHVDQLTFESQGFNGDKVFDVTAKMQTMIEYDPVEISHFRVVYVVVPKNNGVHVDEKSFYVGESYMEFVDGKGKQAVVKVHKTELQQSHERLPPTFKTLGNR